MPLNFDKDIKEMKIDELRQYRNIIKNEIDEMKRDLSILNSMLSNKKTIKKELDKRIKEFEKTLAIESKRFQK